jgi:hypothetical protein
MTPPESLPPSFEPLPVAHSVADVHRVDGGVPRRPAKRQMINVEQLPFPTGMAARHHARAPHQGERRHSRPVAGSAAIGAVITWMRDAEFRSSR